MADIAFGIAGGAQTIRLPVGGEAVLWVEENPTTGFIWQEAQTAAGLAVERLDIRLAPDAGIGAAGRRGFRVRVMQPGTHKLVLELRRPWDAGSTRARVELTVEAS